MNEEQSIWHPIEDYCYGRVSREIAVLFQHPKCHVDWFKNISYDCGEEEKCPKNKSDSF